MKKAQKREILKINVLEVAKDKDPKHTDIATIKPLLLVFLRWQHMKKVFIFYIF